MNKNLSYTVYIDGQYLKVNTKTLEAFTPGLFKADGVFETLLAIGSKVFDVQEHLRRLNASFKGSKLSASIIQRVVQANGFDVSRVRVLAWREKKQIHTAVMALKYTFPKNKIFKVCLIKTNRPASSKFANKKSLDYQLFSNAYRQAKVRGFDDALLINRQGHIFEASRANVFWVKEGKLYTPPLSSGCLKGIVRQQVIDYARQLKVSFKEKNLTLQELKEADAVFLTNSLLGIKFCLPTGM